VTDDPESKSSRPPRKPAPSRQDIKKLPTVRDYMETAVPTLEPDMDIEEAVRFLLQKHRTGAPVIDENGCVVGMLTEFDCLRLLAAGDADHDEPFGTVADFMTTDVVTVEPHTDVYFVAGLFLRHHFRRLPVILDGKLIGAITRLDVLRALELNR
jgi:CBS domain-containing protein